MCSGGLATVALPRRLTIFLRFSAGSSAACNIPMRKRTCTTIVNMWIRRKMCMSARMCMCTHVPLFSLPSLRLSSPLRASLPSPVVVPRAWVQQQGARERAQPRSPLLWASFPGPVEVTFPAIFPSTGISSIGHTGSVPCRGTGTPSATGTETARGTGCVCSLSLRSSRFTSSRFSLFSSSCNHPSDQKELKVQLSCRKRRERERERQRSEK